MDAFRFTLSAETKALRDDIERTMTQRFAAIDVVVE
jgi:hypothetical protein